MNIRRKISVVAVPPACSVLWTPEDWARVTRLVDPAPRRELCGFLYVYDPVATAADEGGQIWYRQAGSARS